ncbi:MAG: glycogen-binding domain-containing protein [Deltaproteobacteria bacterium]|nr:glycogen-binding domain-containing protein [Deltaproteobacteria bacterium]
MIALLLAAAAWPAALDAGGGHLALLGGVDAWSGTAGPVVEARMGGWAAAGLAGSVLSAGLWGSVEALPGRELAWLDAWTGEVRVRGSRGLEPGVGLLARGGLLMDPAWGEGALVASARVGHGAAWIEGALGPLVRGEAEVTTAGGLGSLAAVASAGRLRVTALGTARAFADPGFPPWSLEADLQVAAGSRALAWGTAGVAQSAKAEVLDPVAGLPAPDTTVLRAGLGGTVPLGRALSLSLEAGIETGLGDAPYLRERALMGLAGRFGGARAHREAAQPSTGVRFTLDAPRAHAVAVAGTFSGWAPLPLARGPDGTWVLVVPLPPGEYEYCWLVDGKARSPVEAARRRPDGFGGENGIVVVVP